MPSDIEKKVRDNNAGVHGSRVRGLTYCQKTKLKRMKPNGGGTRDFHVSDELIRQWSDGLKQKGPTQDVLKAGPYSAPRLESNCCRRISLRAEG